MLVARYGIHPLPSVALNLLGGLGEALGRHDLGDRLGVSARLRYCVSGPTVALSTVALLFAERRSS
jgi:hypothetical protein